MERQKHFFRPAAWVGVGKGEGAIKINVNAFAVILCLPAFTAARAGCFAGASAQWVSF
jgi:hypothetical protein